MDTKPVILSFNVRQVKGFIRGREMGSGALDSTQWLSVKEETIFLHDGLMRVADLAELPSELGVSEHGDTEQEVSFSLYWFNLKQ